MRRSTTRESRGAAVRTGLLATIAAGLLVILLGPTTGTQAKWHSEVVATTPGTKVDKVALSVLPSAQALSATVTNTAHAAPVLWAPTAVAVTFGNTSLPVTALDGTALAYASAPAGSCTTAPARWTVSPTLGIAPVAGATRQKRLEPNAATDLCLTIRPGAELLAKYSGQTLTLTTSLEAEASATPTWSAPPATWVASFRVPVFIPPTLEACKVITKNEKHVEISWKWTGRAKGWDVVQLSGGEWVSLGKDVDSSGLHPQAPAGELLGGERRSTTIRPADNSVGDVKVRLYLSDTVFVDSPEAFTFAFAGNPKNDKVVCGAVGSAPAGSSTADVAPTGTTAAPSPTGASPAPSASATPAPAVTDPAAPAASVPSAPAPAATPTPTAPARPATATGTTTQPATEGK